jgi:hypothetical protein
MCGASRRPSSALNVNHHKVSALSLPLYLWIREYDTQVLCGAAHADRMRFRYPPICGTCYLSMSGFIIMSTGRPQTYSNSIFPGCESHAERDHGITEKESQHLSY